MKTNKNFALLEKNYLFIEIDRRVAEFKEKHPDRPLIKMGIGDVTLPLPSVCVSAMEKASREMGDASTFRGYGPVAGYDFMLSAVAGHYKRFGVSLCAEDIFVSDGAKNDIANILDIFDADNTVLVPDPVYPVYVDTNLMAGRRVIYADGNRSNGFLPLPDGAIKADIIYLCSPNNPTGAVYGREALKAWVGYALENDALILFDAAYEAFIGDGSKPHSIFEIEGARDCCIELCSLSKTAGFTGTRCGYTVIPHELKRNGDSINSLWRRRQSTKHNGVSYIIQRGGEAALSDGGYAQCMKNIAFYKNNAALLASALKKKDVFYTGGSDSPYVWMCCPNGMKSWDFFDLLLNEANVVGTPGSGFGKNGEGFFRLTGFGTEKNTATAAERLALLL